MATITGKNIIDRAAIVLQDTTGVRWPQTTELLLWLNDGQREIVLRKPDACAVHTTLTLTTGTKQTIPSAGIQLLDVIRTTGVAARAITRIDRKILDEQMPGWHDSSLADADAKHYMFDPRDPKHFYIYPPQPSPEHGQATIDFIYSSAPTDVADLLTATIGLDDVYAGALLDYVLYRAYSKDADLTPNSPQRAMAHYKAFIASIGAKGEVDQTMNPNAYDYKGSMEAKNVGRG